MLYWAPLLVWAAAILALSSLTPATVERVAVFGRPVLPLIGQATAHAAEFAVMAVLMYRLLRSYRVPAGPYLWAAGLALSIGYGVSDEFHQSFVPGRAPSWADVAFDSLGAAIGLLDAEQGPRLARIFGLGRR